MIVIGILSGMGPKSTSPFIDNVIKNCQELYNAKDDIDFPHMMIYSCPTPFYLDKPINHYEMEKAIIEGSKKLENTGVNFIAIPCNTAHIYFDKIYQSLSIPLLNMIDETINTISINSKKVAILGTVSTIESNIYQNKLKKLKIEYVENIKWQNYVNEIINNIKSKNQINQASILWKKLYMELSDSVDTVIIACTDLNVIIENTEDKLQFIDSSECLAKAIVNRYLEYKNKLIH